MKNKINIHFTDKCNYSCKYCFICKSSRELSIDEIKTIVDKIPVDYRINLAGGEPLCSKNIQEIIDYIYAKGHEVSLITNGSLLTEEFIKHNEDKLSMIGISIDSLSKSKNIEIGRCCYNKAITNERVIELCQLLKKYNIRSKINICISKFNIDEDFYPFLVSANPDCIKFLRVLNYEEVNKMKYDITDEEWKQTIEKYSKLPNSKFEDNDYMENSYIIIDSAGNLTKDNQHSISNSLLKYSFEECFKKIK